MKYYPSFLRPKSHLHAGCMAPIIAVWLRSMSTLLIGPSFAPRAHCSPSHRLHRWASSSHTGRWSGTCAPQSWDHALLHPPFQRYFLHLVPARRKNSKSKTKINQTAAKRTETQCWCPQTLSGTADVWQLQPSGKHHTEQCPCTVLFLIFLGRYDFVCFVRIKLLIS